LREK
jgi:hypothetical protein